VCGSSGKEKQFPYRLRYSPCRNLKPRSDYLAVLFFTGSGDTCVDPSHARKATALLQVVSHGRFCFTPVHQRLFCRRWHRSPGTGQCRPVCIPLDENRTPLTEESPAIPDKYRNYRESEDPSQAIAQLFR
jgi:hypothetical protein